MPKQWPPSAPEGPSTCLSNGCSSADISPCCCSAGSSSWPSRIPSASKTYSLRCESTAHIASAHWTQPAKPRGGTRGTASLALLPPGASCMRVRVERSCALPVIGGGRDAGRPPSGRGARQRRGRQRPFSRRRRGYVRQARRQAVEDIGQHRPQAAAHRLGQPAEQVARANRHHLWRGGPSSAVMMDSHERMCTPLNRRPGTATQTEWPNGPIAAGDQTGSDRNADSITGKETHGVALHFSPPAFSDTTGTRDCYWRARSGGKRLAGCWGGGIQGVVRVYI
jgi:hypothetical protein